jgi:hypothetical protein
MLALRSLRDIGHQHFAVTYIILADKVVVRSRLRNKDSRYVAA